MEFNLKGKTAIVTGASTGLGRQMCRALSSAGVRIILASRRLDLLERFAKELGNAVPVEMDISDKSSVRFAFEFLDKQGEKIDICINNAGFYSGTTIFSDKDDEEFEQNFLTNVFGTWYVTKACVNHMKNHKISGSIINIGSVSAEFCLSSTNAGYSASKAAVNQLSRSLTGDLASYNIRINCVNPGLFITEKNREGRLQIIEDKKLLKSLVPLNFIPEACELDAMILFLASNEMSKYVTGASFSVDGGMSWGGREW